MPFVQLTADTDIEMILGELWMFNPKVNGSTAKELKEHFVKLHKEGNINIIVDNLLDENYWDRTLKIDIKDMSVYGAVKLVIEPLMIHAKYDTIRMLSNNVIEFWWD